MPHKAGLAGTTTLASTMSASATTFTVQSGQGANFAINEVIKIVSAATNDEVMKISGISGDVITVVADNRGYDGTTVAAHASGDTVYKSTKTVFKI